jgi:pre-mRNA-splicing factor CWC22
MSIEKKRKYEEINEETNKDIERENQKLDREYREKIGYETHKPKLKSLETEEEIIKKSMINVIGGTYVPPHKRKRAETQVSDKKSIEYQRLNWDALKKSINGLINKVNISNVKDIIADLFKENLVRARGLLCRALIKSQSTSPNFTAVYCCLISVINTKIPEIGELLVKRLIIGTFKNKEKDTEKHIKETIK